MKTSTNSIRVDMHADRVSQIRRFSDSVDESRKGHILGILGYDGASTVIYTNPFILDFVSVREFLQVRGTLPYHQLRTIIHSLLLAVDSCKDITHGSVNIHNVIIRQNGDDFDVKVGPFGEATTLEGDLVSVAGIARALGSQRIADFLVRNLDACIRQQSIRTLLESPELSGGPTIKDSPIIDFAKLSADLSRFTTLPCPKPELKSGDKLDSTTNRDPENLLAIESNDSLFSATFKYIWSRFS